MALSPRRGLLPVSPASRSSITPVDDSKMSKSGVAMSRWTLRTILRLLASGCALVLIVITCIVRPSTTTFRSAVYTRDDSVPVALSQQSKQTPKQGLRAAAKTNDTDTSLEYDEEEEDMTVSALAEHVSSEVKTHVQALKADLAELVADAVREELGNTSVQAPATEVANVEKAVSHFVNPAFLNGGKKPVCKLNPKGPVPVALVTLGRSGSSSIWQVMGTLTGRYTKSIEYTGSDGKQSKKFLDHWADDDNGNWALGYFCGKQREHPGAGIVGYKWKPFKETFLHPKSLAALRMIAGSHDPQIKIVRSKRNGLDRTLSVYKHRQSGGAPAHCKVGDKECLDAHKRAAQGLAVPVDDMMQRLEQEYQDELMVDRVLQELGVPHVYVSFDELFYGKELEREWARIFEFLGVGPTDGLTREMVEGAMMHAATSSPFHNQTIANFEEVQAALKGTKFESWLH